MEIFKQLKKLGYKNYIDLTIEELDALSINDIEKRIEYSLVIDWFRDKHHTNIEINRFPNISKWGFVVTDMTIIPKQQTRKENINMSLKVADVRRFDEYFECREQAILKAIELCKNEK